MRVAAGGVDLDAAGTNPHGGMDAAGNMAGDMADGMAALERLSGAACDQEFLNRLMVHHSGAVETVEQDVAGGLNTQAQQMAQDTATSQNAEIAGMKTFQAEL